MPILNIVCPICTEVFQNADDVYSTSCGHIFHLSCLNSWQRQGSNCPQCRQYNPTSHKLYLSFEESEANPEEIEELKLKLQSSNEKNIQLQDQMNDTEFNFLKLQEQFTICERAKKELEQKILQLDDSEANFLNLQSQYTETSEHLKDLQDQILELTAENERKEKELRLKCLEKEPVYLPVENVSGDSFDKTKILEQKLKLITAELEKEIQISTQLTVENMKLQSCVNRLKVHESTKKITAPSTKQPPNTNQLKKATNQLKKTTSDSPSQQAKHESDNAITIKYIPLSLISKSLEIFVMDLAFKMNISVSLEDLIKVHLLESNFKAPGTVQLYVQFKTSQLKSNFLEKRNELKSDPSTKRIVMGEYMNDQISSLMEYAKETLKGKNGFNHFFCKNNQIFAKRHRSHPRVFHIINKSHVDCLKAKQEEENSKTVDKSKANEVDNVEVNELFYAV